MGPAATYAWIYEWLGALVAVGAALLLLWSLFSDRARGRRRCPRCWYVMEGVPGFTCPECGRTAASERRLHRTRRRWRWAAVAIALLGAAHLIGRAPAIQARGWWAALPRPALVALLPWVPEGGPGPAGGPWLVPSGLEGEIRVRLLAEPWTLRSLWPGERALTRSASAGALARPGPERRAQLAAELLVLTSADPITASPQAGLARVILARSALAYARCSSYRDTGMVKGTIGVRDERPFYTAYRRDGAFRFEFLSQHPNQTTFTSRYVVWGPAGGPYSGWWTIRPTVATNATIDMATAGPTGVSGGAASNVPSLLTRRHGWITMIKAPTLRATEAFDGRRCYIVRGTDALGFPADLWIDSESFALRKIHKHWLHPSTIVYRPEFDPEIAGTAFQFEAATPDETPLGDGESVASALRDLAGNPREGAVLAPPGAGTPFVPTGPRTAPGAAK